MEPSPTGNPSTAPDPQRQTRSENVGAPHGAGPAGRPRQAARKWYSKWGLGAALVAGGLLLAGCQLPDFGAHNAITTQGQDSVKLWQGFFIAGAAVFALVFSLILWTVFRYRRRSDAIPRQSQYHTLLEIAYTAIPIVFVLILFAFTFATENNVDALPKPKLSVTVTAFQWGWRFHYTTRSVTVIGIELQEPVLVLPEHETVRIYLKSADVIHGFYVPAFDFSRYAQPGVTNKFTVNLDRTGMYRGQCTQFCGLYHSLMRFRVDVVTSSQFDAWASAHSNVPSTVSISQAKKKALSTAVGSSS